MSFRRGRPLSSTFGKTEGRRASIGPPLTPKRRERPHDWTRRYFALVPERPAWHEHLQGAHVYHGTSLEYLARSREGLTGAMVAYRRTDAKPSERRMLVWHGNDRLVQETFQGWFGPRIQRLRGDSFRLLLDRLTHFAVADPASEPTFVLPLPAFAQLGASHGALEAVLDRKVVVATEGLYADGGHLPSLRVYVDYDGSRYGDGARKVFLNEKGSPVVVESVARDLLQQMGYDVVYPNVFRRLFQALIGRPAIHFAPDFWPASYAAARLGPLEWAARGARRIQECRDLGARTVLLESLAAVAKRPAYRQHPGPEGTLPLLGRYLNRARFDSLMDALGERRMIAILEGLLHGYEACAADWFAWQPGGQRSFFCEVKSTGDQLRDTQKSTILWCQRGAGLEYRLLEVLHRRPSRARAARVVGAPIVTETGAAAQLL